MKPYLPLVLPILLTLLAVVCSHTASCNVPADAETVLFSNQQLIAPSKLLDGTAKRFDVETWCRSVMGNNDLEVLRVDLNNDGVEEYLFSQSAHAGTGGNSHLVFMEENRGFRYLGHLHFGTVRVLSRDAEGRMRVLTSSSMGGGECLVRIYLLMPGGFYTVAERPLPCGDSATDGEGGRVFRALFEPENPPTDLLIAVFGAKVGSE